MFERFTDRARKVIVLANQEAQHLNHEYIGTEHVLLGLVKEGSGIGANVLKNCGLVLAKIRLEVEKLVKSGPEMVAMGKLPHTPRTKEVIEQAINEARTLNHTYIGTEHLLLGLLRVEEGVASQVLRNLGVTFEKLRKDIHILLGCSEVLPITKQAIHDLTQWQKSHMEIFTDPGEAKIVNGWIDSIVHLVERYEKHENEDNSNADEGQ